MLAFSFLFGNSGAAKDLLFDYLFFGNECTRIEMEVAVCYCKIHDFLHYSAVFIFKPMMLVILAAASSGVID